MCTLNYEVMNTLGEDVLRLICKALINDNEFVLLIVNKFFRNLIIQSICEELENITHISSLRLHNICIRACSCLPLIKLNKHTTKYRHVKYIGPKVRSNTKFVLAEWRFLDRRRFYLLTTKRINSIMLNYTTRGAVWDLDLHDKFKKPPDALFFIRSIHHTHLAPSSPSSK